MLVMFFTLLLGFYYSNTNVGILNFHSYFHQVLIHWFSMSVCLLANAVLHQRTFSLQLLTTNQQYDPFHITSVLHFDLYSLTFICLTLCISLYIVPFTLNYMKHEPFAKRFYILLNGFIGSMVVLLSANNFWILILG